jgi:hypothetical protein
VSFNKLRHRAVRILELSAINGMNLSTAEDSLDEKNRYPMALARYALDAVVNVGVPSAKLEAAALIREGWNPGEPPVRL